MIKSWWRKRSVASIAYNIPTHPPPIVSIHFPPVKSLLKPIIFQSPCHYFWFVFPFISSNHIFRHHIHHIYHQVGISTKKITPHMPTPYPGMRSILAKSHSLLHNGQTLRVFSHRWMQSRWNTCPHVPNVMLSPLSFVGLGLAWYSMLGSLMELRHMAQCSAHESHDHIATAFHFLISNRGTEADAAAPLVAEADVDDDDIFPSSTATSSFPGPPSAIVSSSSPSSPPPPRIISGAAAALVLL